MSILFRNSLLLAAVGHRYWRLNIFKTTSNDYPGASEIQFRTSLSGSDICSNGSTISGGDYSSSYDKDYAFDNNSTTSWASDATNTGWIGYDFGVNVNVIVVEVSVRSRDVINGPTEFNLEYSDDGSNWTVFASFVNQSAFTETYQEQIYNIWDDAIGAWFSPIMTSANTPSPYTISTSGDNSSSYAGWKAFDRLTGDTQYWMSDANTGWLKLDLGYGHSSCLSAYFLQNTYNNAATSMPNSWVIEGSNDDSIWTTLDSRSSITWSGGANEIKYFTCNTSISYRYFRLNVSANNGGTYLAVAEWSLFNPVSESDPRLKTTSRPSDFSVAPSCKALWKFESSAITVDSKGSHTLTNYNSTGVNGTDYKEGASAAEFNGSTQYLSISNSNLSGSFPFRSTDTDRVGTICCWIKPYSSGTWRPVWGKSNYYWGNNCTHLSVNSGTLFVGWGHKATNVDKNTGITISNNKWYHVAVVIDGYQPSIYVRVYDVEADTVYTYNNTPTEGYLNVGTHNFTIGTWPDWPLYWHGLIDELVVFKDLLTANDIDAIRNNSFNGRSVSSNSNAQIRFIFTILQGGATHTNVALAEIELFSQGSSDLTNTISCTASDNGRNIGGGYVPAGLIDNTTTTMWNSAFSGLPTWCSLELASTATILSSYSFRSRHDAYLVDSPTEWIVQIYNGFYWSTIRTQTTPGTWSLSELRSFTLDTTLRAFVTQQYAEVAISDANSDIPARVTQQYTEVAVDDVASSDRYARVTQQYTEVAATAISSVRNAVITQQYTEVAIQPPSSTVNAVITQQYSEVATLYQPGVFSSGFYSYNDSVVLYGELTELARTSSVDCYFQYREIGSGTWIDTAPQTLTAVGYFSQYISDLTPNGEYEYRVVVEWNSGSSFFATDPYTFKLYWVVERSNRLDYGIVDSLSILNSSLVTNHFYTDFKHYTIGSFPSDFRVGYYSIEGSWTIVSGDALSIADRMLRLSVTTTTNYRRALFVNNSAFQNSIVARVKTNSKYVGASNTVHHGVIIRGSGEGATETCYVAIFRAGPSDLFEIAKYVNGTLTTINNVSFPWSINQYYFIRLNAVDDLIRAKVWEGSISDEPSAWTVSGSDSSISSGRVGLFSFYIGVTSKVVDFDLVHTNQYETSGHRLVPYVLPTRFPASQIRWSSNTPSGTSLSVEAQSKTTSPIVDEVATLLSPSVVVELSDTAPKSGTAYAGVYATITTTKSSIITEVRYKSALTSQHRFRLQSSDGTIDYADIYSSTKDGNWVVFTLSSPVTLSTATSYRFYFTFSSQSIFYNTYIGYFGEYFYYTQVFIDGLGLRTAIIGLSVSCTEPITQARLAYWPTNTPSITVDDIEETEFSLDINDNRLIIFDSPLSADAVVEAAYTAVDDPIENDWEEQTDESAITLFTGWEYTEGQVLWLRQSFETTDQTVSPSLSLLEIELSGSIALLLSGNIEAESSTLSINLDGVRTLASNVDVESTVGIVALDILRGLTSDTLADSSTSSIDIVRVIDLFSNIEGSGSTSAITASISRETSSTVYAASQTSDSIWSAGLNYISTINVVSSTSDIVLFTDKVVDDSSLLWPLIHAQSELSEAHLNISGDTELDSNIFSISATSSIPLAVQLYFSGSILAYSSTANLLLGTIRPLSSTAIAESVTSNVDVTFEVLVASNISAVSYTDGTDLAIVREVSSSISSISSTSQAILTTEISWSSSVLSLSQTSIIEIEVLRPLTGSLYAESFLAQPSLTVFEEDPIDDEIIALARNYRIVIPAVALNGSGDQIRVKFRAHSAQSTIISGSSIGQRIGSTEDYRPTTPVRLKFNNGANSYTIPGGTEYWSDWVDFDLDSTIDHFVHVFINANPHYYRTKDQAGPTYIRQGAFDDTMVEDVPSIDYTLDTKHYHVVAIEARENSIIGVERSLSSNVSAASELSVSRLGLLIVFDRFITAFSSTSVATFGVEYEVLGLIIGQSDLSDIDLDYVLHANINASSIVSNINLLVGVDRYLDASITATSTTTATDLLLDWKFSADVSAISSTSDIELGVVSAVLFTSNIYADSSISDNASLALSIAVSSTISSESSISVDLIIHRSIATNIEAESAFYEVSLVSYKEFVSDLLSDSLTSASEIDILRSLYSDIVGVSDTYSVFLSIVAEVDSSIISNSQLSHSVLSTDRVFSSNIVSNSSASPISFELLRNLYTDIYGLSNVSDLSLTIVSEFSLTANIQAQSDVLGINLWVSSIRELWAQSFAFASTTLASIEVVRPLFSEVESGSFHLQPILSIDRSQNSVISTESATSDAYLSLIRGLFSSLFAPSYVEPITLLTCAPFYADIVADSLIDNSIMMADLLPLIVDTRIFQETPERVIDSVTPIRIYISSTPVRVIQSQTILLSIELRTGTEVYSLPYEIKPYPFV